MFHTLSKIIIAKLRRIVKEYLKKVKIKQGKP
jgi:hypothetical protein